MKKMTQSLDKRLKQLQMIHLIISKRVEDSLHPSSKPWLHAEGFDIGSLSGKLDILSVISPSSHLV
jgi:hypothetical protein